MKRVAQGRAEVRAVTMLARSLNPRRPDIGEARMLQLPAEVRAVMMLARSLDARLPGNADG
jgi:hypothetical protein